ncbi:MAG: SDR family oxidoreductase [Anaerolineales bacterium]|nr:SDR family oxidoreductase [Anaerolineales bacterium]
MEILVTGVTGYIGGRLVPRLLEKGYAVRCMVRDPERLKGRSWQGQVEIIQGDVFDSDSLKKALVGINTAYYLIHSMGGGQNFHQRDLIAARNFGSAARACGVKNIIYLGGLGDPNSDLSEHLRSRQQTGQALGEAGVAVTEFRAAIIVGSGSLSFEMIRYLTERVPIMICPRWVFTRAQPISIHNVLDYLVAALEQPVSHGQIIEIGGQDVLTYGDMMTGYAQVRGLRRWLISVPVLTPRLSSYWVHLVTPIPADISAPLIEGLRNEVIVRITTAQELFPQIQPMDYQTAVRDALDKLLTGQVETAWSDALVTTQGELPPVILETKEGMVLEKRQLQIAAPPAEVFRSFSSLGGETGWLYMNWAWELRGLIDRLIGGVGMRRGRRDQQKVRVGDAIDFWRVEAVEEDHLLRLRAEMKVPGLAWLEFMVEPHPAASAWLSQTAIFAPKGLFGWLYWYALYPIHGLIFSGMIQRIAARAVTDK